MYANFPRYAEVDKDLRNWLNEGNIRLQQLYTHPFTPDMKVYLFIYLFFIFNYKALTYNTYLQTMYGTYATNKTILYLQNNTYLQCEILTLLTILYSTYNTKNLQYLLTMRYLHY